MQFKNTNGSNADFILLCHELDAFLNDIVGGEENRTQYVPYNQLNDIHDVIVAYDNNIPIGCASFKKYDAECAEVKRVFIRQAYRGKGISKKLMQLLEEKAKENRYTYLVLESGEPLVEAMRLYHSIGYEAIPNYGQYKDMPNSICMKKRI
jgi:GNAT superfamily N-acetyltransferase